MGERLFLVRAQLHRLALGAILAAYAVLVVLFATNVPRWNAPDEPAHFNYARELAEQGTLPILTAGSYDFAYLERLKAARFPADMSIDSLRYEAHQPPLYYLASAAVYRITAFLDLPGQVLALRLLSALFGAALVALGYLLARSLFPRDRWLPIGTSAFLAFNPMLLAVNSAIGNDPAANLVLAAILLQSIRLVQTESDTDARGHLRLGFLVGLALLIKATAYAGVVIAAVAIIARVFLLNDRRRSYVTNRHFTETRNLARLAVARSLSAAVVALLVSGWWFARNVSVYGLADPLGLRRHDQLMLAGGQPPAPPVDADSLYTFVTVTFRSFWGQFGWMGVLFDDKLYLVLAALTLAAVGGLFDYAIRPPKSSLGSDSRSRWALALLTLTVMLVAAAMAQYSFGSFLQPQGRYLFPSAVPISIFLVLGLRQLAPRRHGALTIGSLAISLVVLDLASLYGYIIPGLSNR